MSLTTFSGPGKTFLRRLLQLDQPVPSRTESEKSEIATEVEQNYRWNFTVNFLDGTVFWFGLNFISGSTIVPLFVSKLTDSTLLIGLVAVIAQASWYLPQVLSAGPIEKLARKKPVVINLGFFLERLPVWLWPAAALVAFYSPGWALFLFFLGYAWHGLGAGIIAPAWQDMIARCFPVNRRGRFWGTTNFVGTGVGTLGAIFSGWLLENYSFPYNFGLVFSIAALALTLSWVFLALTREPVRSIPPAPEATPQVWAKLTQIIRQDRNFRHYLQFRILLHGDAFGRPNHGKSPLRLVGRPARAQDGAGNGRIGGNCGLCPGLAGAYGRLVLRYFYLIGNFDRRRDCLGDSHCNGVLPGGAASHLCRYRQYHGGRGQRLSPLTGRVAGRF
jgi:MFS family permease